VRALLVGNVVEARGRELLEGHLRVVVHVLLVAAAEARRVDARGLELALLLERREAPRFVELRLARLAFGLLAARVGQARARLAQHLEFVLVHVDGVGPRGPHLRVGVDLAGAEPPHLLRRLARRGRAAHLALRII